MPRRNQHQNIPSIEITASTPSIDAPLINPLRPSSSRQLSSSSVRSSGSSRSRGPHRQQHEYVSSGVGTSAYVGGEAGDINGFDERWQFEQAEEEAEAEAEEDEGESEDEWDNLREDESMSRRPAWRKPSPNWIYFFITGATLSMGMGMAPKSELYINLACLAHPPQQPRSASVSASSNWVSPSTLDSLGGAPLAYDGNDRVITSRPALENPFDPTLGPLSPADEWFLKLQREMYEHRHHVSVPANPPAPGSSDPPGPATPLPGTGGSDGGPSDIPDPGNKANNGTDHDSPYREIDPRLCKKDPKVQGAAARLTMMISLTSGILAALTTGYWGQTSDRLGRRRVMTIVEIGLFLSESCFVLVATFPYYAPGGYRALLIGPALDGLLGGFSTITATVSAYISDTTPDGSRATVFARMSGIMMVGFAIGPVLGSSVIAATGNIMAIRDFRDRPKYVLTLSMMPFYINVCVHLTYIFLIFFLLPESLSKHARQILHKKAVSAKDAAKRRDIAEREWEGTTPLEERDDPIASGFSTRTSAERQSKWRKRWIGNARRLVRRAFSFLAPLAIFAPRVKDDGRKDWNMTFVGSAMFFSGMIYGIIQVKTQFALYAYGWTSRELGPFMSLNGFARALVLLGIVPLIMRYAKPHFSANPSPTSLADPLERGETDPLLDQAPLPDQTTSTNTKSPSTTAHRPALLDLYTVRASLMIELIPYCLLALNPSATQFVILSTLVTFGSATGPAANSLALSLIPSSREAGRLFGALGVIQALGSTIISPLMFGTLFASTVGWYAPTIFVLAVGLLIVALILFFCVRVEPRQGDEERGRSRKVRTGRANGRGTGTPK